MKAATMTIEYPVPSHVCVILLLFGDGHSFWRAYHFVNWRLTAYRLVDKKGYNIAIIRTRGRQLNVLIMRALNT